MSPEVLRVLLLDDDEEEFLIVRRLLARASRPYALEWTADAREALAAMAERRHDVYLVDYRLGALTGLEVIREAVQAGVEAPLILLTGAAAGGEHEVDIEAIRSGAADYLGKDALTSEALERSIRYARERAHSAVLRENLGRAEQEGARLQAALAQVERQARRLRLLAESSALFAAAASRPAATLVEVARRCADVLGDACAIALLDDERRDAVVRAFQHVDPAAQALGAPLVGARFALEGTISGDVVKDARPRAMALRDASALASIGAPPVAAAFHARRPLHAVLVVPLRAAGETLGTIVMMRHRSDAPYTEEDQALLQDIADRGGLAIQNALLFEAQVTARERERAARQEAEEANRAKDDFLAMLGHELRNPLAPIVTALQLLRLRGSEGIKREVDVIERQAQHLVRLVDDLLDVARIARGKVTLDREDAEIAEVVAAAIEMASPLVESGLHRLVLDVPARGLVVRADRVRLAQVIANLLTNAAKYTPRGGRISVSAKQVAEQIEVKVEDTGSGIEPELLPHVFDLFVQSRQTLDRARGGLGLGLAIVKNLVAMHGGTVTAESAGAGKGSTFTVRLPLAPPSVGEQSGTASQARVARAAPVEEGRRVLVVDDNKDAADMLAEALGALGYATVTAHDGAEALRAAEQFRPEIGLLDIGLPVIDGYELARQLRARHGDLRLVAVTGYGQPADKTRARAAGFCRHVTKPVDLDSLVELLQDVSKGE